MIRWLLCCILMVSTAASAAEEMISLNFVNADVEEVIRAVSQITQRNFLVDPRVKGNINIVSATPIPASLAYDTLLSALRLQGFAAVESNGVTKVLPEAEAKLYIPNVGEKSGSGDKLMTRVFMLHHESAVQMVPILRPLIAPNNVVAAYGNNNALVVTDYASNLKRIEQLINSLDQSPGVAATVIPVKFASAVDLAQVINRLMLDGALVATGSSDASMRFMLTVDARTNSLLLKTDSPARISRVQELIDKLDVQTSAPGNIHVVYLKNADAVKLAQTLRAVLSGDTSAATPVSTPASGAGTSASGSTSSSGTAAQQPGATLITGPGALDGHVLTPGVYKSASTMVLGSGQTLTLDAFGDVNGIWLFQVGSSLTITGSTVACTSLPTVCTPTQIILRNGAQAKNVFWQVGTPRLAAGAPLGGDVSFTAATGPVENNTVFVGTIMAGNSVSFAGGTTVVGRVLAGADLLGLPNTQTGGAVTTSGGSTGPVTVTLP